jgi:hypothetical protein
MLRKILEYGGLVLLCYSSILDAAPTTPSQSEKTVKLSPRIRVEPIKNPDNVLTDDLRLRLTASLVLDTVKQFNDAPYILAESEGQVQGGNDITVFVRGLSHTEELVHSVYGEGKEYKHPVTGEELGYEIIPVGKATLTKAGDPAELRVTEALKPIEIGMRIFPAYALNLPTKLRFIPAAKGVGEGYILSAHNSLDQIGKDYTVVISLGQRDGIEEGNYLEIYQVGQIVADKSTKNWRRKMISLPDKRIGRLLVYQVYEKMSVAIVTEATDIVHVLDKLKSP